MQLDSTTQDTGPSPASGPAASAAVFSRTASGLVRVAGSWDVFIFNVGLVSVGIAVAYNQFYGPSLYPGAAVWLSTLLASLGMVVAATVFYLWSVVFPRSGGMYVFLSRTWGPAVAFVFTVLETVIILYYGALAASLIAKVGLSCAFAAIGAITGSGTLINWAGWVAGASGVFWVGSAMIVLAALLLATGTRRYFSIQKVLFVIALLGTVACAVAMLFGSRSGFQAHLTKLTGLHYDSVISTARSHGFVTADFSFSETVKFLVWPLLALLGAIQSVGIGGEIKRVRRTQLVGMLGAVISTGVVIAIFALLASKVFGNTFQGAIAFNSINGVSGGSTDGPLGVSPYFTVLAAVLTDNVVLTVLVMAMFIAWIWFWVPAQMAYTTRTMIAWSFDRLAPNALGHVSRRFNTPVIAIGVSTVIALVFMWLIAYKDMSLLTLAEPLLVIWGAALAAAIVFPWTRRQFYERSPASRWKIGPLPLMTVSAVLALAFFMLVLVMLWRDPIAAGSLLKQGKDLGIVVGTLAAGIIWYIGNRVYRRTQGVDVDLAFREIPIE
jgi:amino acid transporter